LLAEKNEIAGEDLAKLTDIYVAFQFVYPDVLKLKKKNHNKTAFHLI